MNNSRRKKQCIIMFMILLPAFLYLSWSLASLCVMGDLTLNNLEENIKYSLSHFYLPEKNNDKTVAFIGMGIIVWMLCFIMYYQQVAMNLMHGKEHGTAQWGSIKAFNKKYAEEIETENKILSENIRMKYDSSTLRNNNTFVVGGSGSGKTFFFATPNLLNNHGSMVYTDPKGSLLDDYGNYLKKQPYTRVCQINLCEMEKSMRFNPFAFIRKRSDVSRLIRNIMLNTAPAEGAVGSADPFWDRAESLYLQAIFLYVWLECPRTEYDSFGNEIYLRRNFETVINILDEAKVSDDGEKSPLDIRLERLEAENPKHPAVVTYHRFMAAAGDTLRSIIICANSRFNLFDDPEILRILSDNDIPLDEIGTGKNGDGRTKTHLFLIIPDDDDTYNFIPGMIYTLLFQELYYQARFFRGNKLPLDVGIWLDEFANIKMPPNFEKILATCRSRGIYCVPILQSLAQIKKLFKDGAWEGVVGNCDTFIYLGGNEQSSHKYVSELLGKWTIDKRTEGESKGTSGSVSKNYDVLGRDLMDATEIRLLPNEKCIIFVRGEKPLIDFKWNPLKKSIYKTAINAGEYVYDPETELKGKDNEIFECINDKQMDYYTKLSKKSDSILIYDDLDPVTLLEMEDKEIEHILSVNGEDEIEKILNSLSSERLEEIAQKETEQMESEEFNEFLMSYSMMSLLDIIKSPLVEEQRKECIKKLKKLGLDDETIKDEVSMDIPLGEVLQNVELAVEYYAMS